MKKMFLLLLLSISFGNLFGADPGSFCEDPVVIQGDGCSDIQTMTGTEMWFLITATSNSQLFQVTNLDTLTGYVESITLYPAVCGSLPLFTASFGKSRQLVPLLASGLTAGNQYLICVKRVKLNLGDAVFTLCREFWGTDGQATPCSNPCNLICNGSFEDFDQGPSGDCLNCSSFPNQFDACLNNHCWASLQVQECYNGACTYFSTPDFGNVCTTYTCVSDPVLPHCGNSVIGLAVRGSAGLTPNNLYREAIVQRNLTLPFAGTYRVSYWIKRLQDDEVVNFGFWLTQSNVANGNFSITQTPSYSTPIQQGYGWQQITGFVTVAAGGSYNLVIGSFNNTNLDLGISYFLIDDVEMTIAPPNVSISPNPTCSSSPITIFADPGFDYYSWASTPAMNGLPTTGNSFVIQPPIAPGTYTLSLNVGLSDLCASSTYTIQVIPGPSSILTPSGPLYLCNNYSSVQLSASTNLPSEIDWYYNPNSPNGPGNQNLNCHGCTTYSATQAGYYYFEVIDPSTGCTAKSNVVHVILDPLILTTFSIPENCAAANDGSASVTVSGGTTPYSYSWTPVGGVLPTTPNNLDAGTYSVTVTSSNGCIATATVNVGTLSVPPPVITSNALNGNLCSSYIVTYTVSNFDPTLSYTASGSPTPVSITSPIAGVFSVDWGGCQNDVTLTVTANNGNPVCSASTSLTVFQCCPCGTVPPTDLVMTGTSNSDDLMDLLNTYNPLNTFGNRIWRVGNNWFYSNPTGILYINGTFTINSAIATNVTFMAGSDVRMGANAKINITGAQACTMNINQSHFWAGCNTMWDGIYFSGVNKAVNVNGTATQASLIEDAQHGLVSGSGADISLNYAVFNKNYISVNVGLYGPAHPAQIRNSVFTCRNLTFSGLTILSLKGIVPPNQSLCQLNQLPVGNLPPATLLFPYLNKRSYAGVMIAKIGNTTVNPNTQQVTGWTNITVGSGNANQFNLLTIFDNMDYGVYATNSNVIVRNCQFQNLSGPTTITKGGTNYGVGVYGINDALNQSKKIIVGPNNARNSFYDCNRGVDLNGYYEADVTGNCFKSNIVYSPGLATQSPVGNFAVFVKSGRYINTNLNGNTIINWATGIAFFSEYLPSGPAFTRRIGELHIDNNVISPVVSGSPTAQYIGTAIVAYALSLNCGTCTTSQTITGHRHFDNNIITNAFNGIDIQGWPTEVTILADNYITLRYQPNFLLNVYKQAGIRSIACPSVLVYRNNIYGDANTRSKLDARGIYMISNNNSIVRCNSMTDVGQCMVFNGLNQGGVERNIMNASINGLVLENNGIIGQQGSNAGNGQVGDNMWVGPFTGNDAVVDAFSCASNSKFWVRSNLAPWAPQTDQGPSLPCRYNFNNLAGMEVVSSNNPSTFNCNTPAPAIVAQSNGNGNNVRLMERIVQDSVQMYGYANETSWMNKHEVYVALQYDQTPMNSSPVLQQFYASAPATNVGKTVNTDVQLVQTNTTAASGINQTVTPQLPPEQNYKDVNEIYISLLNGVPADTNQLQALENIAAQCPEQGGIAVYRARVLLDVLYDGLYYWSDTCSPSSARLAPPQENTDQQTSSSNVMLYPNPNDGNMTLTYTLPEGQQGQFVLYDAMGNIVDTEVLQPGTQNQTLLLTGLASGIYLYQVTFDSQIIKADKIIIQK